MSEGAADMPVVRARHPLLDYLRAIGAVIWKDVLAELRSRELLSAMLVFSLLVILIFNFALELDIRWTAAGAGRSQRDFLWQSDREFDLHGAGGGDSAAGFFGALQYEPLPSRPAAGCALGIGRVCRRRDAALLDGRACSHT